jgi:group I intron endonuclease
MSEFKSGIYKITNRANGKIYLGQAINLDKRLRQHKSELRNNKHKNNHLQAAYNKYGASAFTFEPILYCDESLLNEYEIDLIYLSESYKPEIGYNKTMGGESERPTEEVKAKMSKAKLGNTHTEESKVKMSIIKRGINNAEAKLTEDNVIDILKTCNDSKSMKNAAIKYNVSFAAIYDVVKKRTWKHIIESVA